MIFKIFDQEVLQIPSDIDGLTTGLPDPIAYLTGLEIHIDEAEYPDPRHPYYIHELTIKNVYWGLIKSGNGNLRIGKLNITDTGGDAIRIHGSNVKVDKLEITNGLPTQPYCGITLPHGTNENNFYDRLETAFAECNQEVRSVKEVAWIKVFDRENKGYYSIPGDHADLVQAYNLECNSDGHRPNVSRLQLTSEDFSEIIDGLQENARLKSASTQELMQNILNGISKISHKRKVNPKTKEIDSIELMSSSNIIEFNATEKFVEEPMYFDLDNRRFLDRKNFRSELRSQASCAISSVHLTDVNVRTEHRNTQVFMLSEENNYTDFKIGTRNLKVHCAYSYWLVANTLNNSEIGNLYRTMDITCANKPALPEPTSTSCGSNCGNRAVCTEVPTIRIGDGIAQSPHKIKVSTHRTSNVIFNRLSNVMHRVPPSLITYSNP